MKHLFWSRAAQRDLNRIADHYDQLALGMSDDMLARCEVAPLVLLDHPEIGSPTRDPDLRKWPVRKTSFILFYRVRGSEVRITRVVHERSDWA